MVTPDSSDAEIKPPDSPIEPGFTPPYPAFRTFDSFIRSLGDKAVPPRIDRSLMVGTANGLQTQILNALREFNLIDDTNHVTDLLLAATESEEARMRIYRKLLAAHYPEQIALSEARGTAAQLAESFKPHGYQGSTLRKAVTFFLNMAAASDVPLSPHFRPPAQRTNVRKRAATRTEGPENGPVSPQPVSTRNAVRCDLPSGGTLTLVCEVDFVHLSREDREFMYQLIDQVTSYAPLAPSAPSKTPVPD